MFKKKKLSCEGKAEFWSTIIQSYLFIYLLVCFFIYLFRKNFENSYTTSYFILETVNCLINGKSTIIAFI